MTDTSNNSRSALVAGGLAALLASACCLGPLVLVLLGVSGAWICNLTALEPYRPIFIGVALGALFFAGHRIFKPAQACEPGEVCAMLRIRKAYKVVFWVVAALVLLALAFPYFFRCFTDCSIKLSIKGVHHEKTCCIDCFTDCAEHPCLG